MSTNEDYIKAMQKDKELSTEYFLKHLHTKSEQQKFLERLLAENKTDHVYEVGDIACGAGTLSYHIGSIFPQAKYTLVDLNTEALELASVVLKEISAEFHHQSIYDLSMFRDKFDMVFCWQTLSWLDKPEEALTQLVNSCKKGGKIYLSSLFNTRHDVDIYANVLDYTRASAQENISLSYNTYSAYSVDKWLKGKVRSYKFHEFVPSGDFSYEGRGLGTYTIKTEEKGRLQISAGMLMNWSILEIEK